MSVIVDLGVDNVKGGYFIEVKFGVFSAASNLKIKIKTFELVIKGIQSFRAIKDLEEDKTNILNFDIALNVQANIGEIDVDVSQKMYDGFS